MCDIMGTLGKGVIFGTTARYDFGIWKEIVVKNYSFGG